MAKAPTCAVTALAAEKSAAATRSAREEAERKAAVEAAAASEAAKRSESRRQHRRPNRRRSVRIAPHVRTSSRVWNRVLPTRETERGIVAEIAGVQFAVGAATLNSDAREALRALQALSGSIPPCDSASRGTPTALAAHCDESRSLLKRAGTVRDYCVAQGVSNSSINVDGLGPDRPR